MLPTAIPCVQPLLCDEVPAFGYAREIHEARKVLDDPFPGYFRTGHRELAVKVAYFDCIAGASGDMILGALLDAGLDLDLLKREIGKLGLTNYDLGMEEVTKNGIGGSKALVIVDQEYHGHHHRNLGTVKELIERSSLSESVRGNSIAVFEKLAKAEARIHRSSIDDVHFHEVGAVDAIIDIVGTMVGLEALEVDKIYCSPLPLGAGTVHAAHGTLPVPAPATLELLRGKPVYSNGVEREILTPTAAAILTTLASDFGPHPPLTLERIGYGAGTYDLRIPNLLRLIVGEAAQQWCAPEIDRIAAFQARIDNMHPHRHGHITDKLREMGAFHVSSIPVQTRNNGPGVQIEVVCREEMTQRLVQAVLEETGS